jgi:hypothetical protein
MARPRKADEVYALLLPENVACCAGTTLASFSLASVAGWSECGTVPFKERPPMEKRLTVLGLFNELTSVIFITFRT